MQASVHQAAFAYFTMLAIIVMIFTMVFEVVNQKLAHASVIAFYGLLFIWYMGIVIDYYTLLASWITDMYIFSLLISCNLGQKYSNPFFQKLICRRKSYKILNTIKTNELA